MERRVIRKVDNHLVGFKNAIKVWLEDAGVGVCSLALPVSTDEALEQLSMEGLDKTSEFLKYIFDYEGIEFAKEDFQKRKRVKNVVPHCERCSAKRANGDQCTRRKSGQNSFCGTHAKGTPHGIMSGEPGPIITPTKIEVWVEEIQGIHYYIDSSHNVYKHDDVLNNKSTPDVIAKWELTPAGVYCIPEYEM